MKHPAPKQSSRNGYIPNYRLAELFDTETIDQKRQLAGYYIAQTFAHAKERAANGRFYGTDLRIFGIGPKQSGLTSHIVSKIKTTKLVCVSDLPRELDEFYRYPALGKIAAASAHQLIMAEVADLVQSGHIWCDFGVPGHWEMQRSAVDHYLSEPVANSAHKAQQTARRQDLHRGKRLVVVH